MVEQLSHEEVLKVCSSCASFDKGGENCKANSAEGPKNLKEIHHCKKWDEFYHSPCVYQK